MSFSIPTSVPLAVKSDGTIIAPDSSSWRIENTGSTPITLDNVTASGMKNGTVINFSTSPVPLYETDASSDYWVYTGTSAGSYLDIHNEDNMHPAIINSSSSVKVAWSAPAISSNELHLVSSSPLKIADIAFSVKPVYQQTFAVYSDDDKSLDFYKRVSTSLPAQGDTFNGKKATSVYTGFENGGYSYDQVSSTNTPWFEHHEDITKIGVIDSGIKIYNLAAFFSQFTNLTNADDVVKFDTSECISIHDLFHRCTSLKKINLSDMDVSSMRSLSCIFHYDSALEKDVSRAISVFQCRVSGVIPPALS